MKMVIAHISLTTDFFNLTIPKGSMVRGLGTKGQTVQYSSLRTIILKPLPVGDHTIGIKAVQITPNEEDRLDLDMKYIMHVK